MGEPKPDCLHELLTRRVGACAEGIALLASGRPPLAWAGLLEQAEHVRRVLSGLGIGPGDPVATVLPEGPELAAAFLSIASCATFAPLHPAYSKESFEFYLADLHARALVLSAGTDSAARQVAQSRGIPILDLATTTAAPAGRFILHSSGAIHTARKGPLQWATPEDPALLLHTSGTSSRPKQVPLSHRNLCCSARHIAETLRLTPADRALCVMPLFHIHGLVGVLLTSVAAGAEVACTPGFDAERFPEDLWEFEPTWYSAVPTIHQAALAQARSKIEPTTLKRLRFLRSSSSALPPAVMAGLEEFFGVPVTEAYGMTEASHQMASNPLPPGRRKPGSVGLPAGPEMGIMDETGRLLPPGHIGEIVIRGPNVTRGYANNPAANDASFQDGWFRTGDQGRFDEDGYLFISGRIKELINRGGEKIAPREVDEALLRHPAVKEAATFGVPHPTLGEDVAAAVVLTEPSAADGESLRQALLRNLPSFMVPSQIVCIDAMPKGPTGKVQRIGMHERLAAALIPPCAPPEGELEQQVALTFRRVLGADRIGRHDNFFSLGGDSIRATQVLAGLGDEMGVDPPPVLLFQAPTVSALARALEELVGHNNLDGLADKLAQLPADEVERLLDETTEETSDT